MILEYQCSPKKIALFFADICGVKKLMYFCGTFWFVATRLKGNPVKFRNRPATVSPTNAHRLICHCQSTALSVMGRRRERG